MRNITLQTKEDLQKHGLPVGAVYYIGSEPTISQKYGTAINIVSDYYSTTMNRVKKFLINTDACFSDPCMMLNTTVSANRYLSPLFDELLAAYTLHYLLQSLAQINATLVVDTQDAIELYGDFLRKNGYKVLINKSDQKSFIKIFVKKVYQILRSNILFIKDYLQTKKYKQKNKINFTDYIFITWLPTPKFLNKSTLYEKNRYFGHMPGHINVNRAVSFLGLTIDGDMGDTERHKVVKDQELPVLFVYAFSKFNDMIFSLWKNFQVIFLLLKKYKLEDINISIFIHRALVHDLCKGQYLKALLYYRCFLGLLPLLPNETFVIYPFENQPWERALLLAKRKIQNSVKIFAYQFFPIPSNFLIYEFSRQSKALNCVPDGFLSSDTQTHQRFIDQNFSTYPLGSSRYEEISHQFFLKKTEKSMTRVLCSLFLDPAEAIPLLKKSIAVTKCLNLTLWVNYHPMIAWNVIQDINEIATQYPHVEILNKPVSELLPHTFVQLYNSSSVCYEAALCGTPPIYVSCEGLPNLNRFSEKIESFYYIKDGLNILRNFLSDTDLYQGYAKKVMELAKENLFSLELGLLNNL
jgi:hypothetical protein